MFQEGRLAGVFMGKVAYPTRSRVPVSCPIFLITDGSLGSISRRMCPGRSASVRPGNPRTPHPSFPGPAANLPVAVLVAVEAGNVTATVDAGTAAVVVVVVAAAAAAGQEHLSC